VESVHGHGCGGSPGDRLHSVLHGYARTVLYCITSMYCMSMYSVFLLQSMCVQCMYVLPCYMTITMLVVSLLYCQLSSVCFHPNPQARLLTSHVLFLCLFLRLPSFLHSVSLYCTSACNDDVRCDVSVPFPAPSFHPSMSGFTSPSQPPSPSATQCVYVRSV